MKFFKDSRSPADFRSFLETDFDYSDPKHLKLVTETTGRFRAHLESIQKEDMEILGSVAIAAICMTGSSTLPFAFLLSLVAFSMQAHAFQELGKRECYYDDHYRHALNDCIQVYRWAMSTDSGQTRAKLRIPELQNLISTLGPYLPPEELVVWKEEDMKAGRERFTWYDELPMAFVARLLELEKPQRLTGLPYRLYGRTSSNEVCREVLTFLWSYAPDFVSRGITRAKETVTAHIPSMELRMGPA